MKARVCMQPPSRGAITLTAMEAVKLVTTRGGAVRFEILARPRARVSRIAAVREGAIVVQLAAPPVDGAANEELIATLAQALRVTRRCVVLVRGGASRVKLVEIHGLVEGEVRTRLTAALLQV
jgi:uncharacterized protein (TIGR00251 family)